MLNFDRRLRRDLLQLVSRGHSFGTDGKGIWIDGVQCSRRDVIEGAAEYRTHPVWTPEDIEPAREEGARMMTALRARL